MSSMQSWLSWPLLCFSLTMLQLHISSSVFGNEWPIIVCSVPVSVLPRPCIMTLLFIGGSVIAITFLDKDASVQLPWVIQNKEIFTPWIFKFLQALTFLCAHINRTLLFSISSWVTFKTLTENRWSQIKQVSDLVRDRDMDLAFNYCKYRTLSLTLPTLIFHKCPEVYNPAGVTAAGQGDWTEQRLGITAEWIPLAQSQGLSQRSLSCRLSISSYRPGLLNIYICIDIYIYVYMFIYTDIYTDLHIYR